MVWKARMCPTLEQHYQNATEICYINLIIICPTIKLTQTTELTQTAKHDQNKAFTDARCTSSLHLTLYVNSKVLVEPHRQQ